MFLYGKLDPLSPVNSLSSFDSWSSLSILVSLCSLTAIPLQYYGSIDWQKKFISENTMKYWETMTITERIVFKNVSSIAASKGFCFLHIQKAACSGRPAPGPKHLEEWGWTESSPWPGPCEVLEINQSNNSQTLLYAAPYRSHIVHHKISNDDTI